MPEPWRIGRSDDGLTDEPPLVMGVIHATLNVLEMNRIHYLDWLDSRIRQLRLDGADIIELSFETRNLERIEACESIATDIASVLLVDTRNDHRLILSGAMTMLRRSFLSGSVRGRMEPA
jgi:hypothetical protein